MKEKLRDLAAAFLAVRIFRQIITASICKVVDVGLFYVFDGMSGMLETVWLQVLFATVLARIPSAVLNYFLNRRFVFESDAAVGSSFAKFIGVAAVQLFLSWFGTASLSELFSATGLFRTGIKLAVDVALFFVSYLVQKLWVFKGDEQNE
jgi:putative flippase GtrA